MTRMCDLKSLEGEKDVLSVGTLELGHYTQIRLMVQSATLYFDFALPDEAPACAEMIVPPGVESALLEIPSGEVKLNRQFDLDDDATEILLDFDGDASIKETANGYIMTPVIAIVSVD